MLDQKTFERPPELVPQKRNSRAMAFGAVLALAVLGLGAWALAERAEADGRSGDLTAAESQIAELEAELAGTSDVLAVGRGDLTARQQEMVSLVTGPWLEAWRAGDGEAVAKFYTADAIAYDIAGGDVLTASDGTLQSFVSRWQGINLQPGMMLHRDRMFFVLRYASRDVGVMFQFTPSGEVRIESTAMYDSALAPGFGS